MKKFRVVLTKSRIEKGLLAISKRFYDDFGFPKRRGRVQVLLDDAIEPQFTTYSPYESTTRECRIGGLRKWFKSCGATAGDLVEVIIEDMGHRLFRLIFHKRDEEERQYRQQLQEAKTDTEAEQALRSLADIQRRSVKKAALKELERLSQMPWERRRVLVSRRDRYERAPAGLRTLLKKVYEGKCQICGFTFRMRNGEPYFEVHHIDPDAGHQPQNLLVLCANCHAQMEHARVDVNRNEQGWVIAVIINGRHYPVRQAIALGRGQGTIAMMNVLIVVLLAWRNISKLL